MHNVVKIIAEKSQFVSPILLWICQSTYSEHLEEDCN